MISSLTNLVNEGQCNKLEVSLNLVFLRCFLQVPALESVEQGGISNHTEAVLIRTLLSLLIKVQDQGSRI